MEKLAVFELEQKRNERLHLLMGVAVERRWKEERDMWKERAEQLSKDNSRLVSLMSPPKQHSTPRHHSDSGNSLDLMEIPLRIHVNNLEAVREEIESEFKSSLSTESSSCLTGPSMHASLVENTSNSTVVQLQSVNNNNNMEDSEVFDETELKMPVESLSGPDVRLELVQEGGEKAVLMQWLMPTDTAGDAVRGYQVFVMEGGEAGDGEGAWSQMGAELPASRSELYIFINIIIWEKARSTAPSENDPCMLKGALLCLGCLGWSASSPTGAGPVAWSGSRSGLSTGLEVQDCFLLSGR